MATQKEKLFRAIAFLWGLLECGIFAGLAFGWAAVVYVFKGDGIYSHLCDNATGRFHLCFHLASVQSVTSPPTTLHRHMLL